MSVVVRNMSDSPIYLKKGVQIAHVISVTPVLPIELSPEMEATLGAEAQQETMSVCEASKAPGETESGWP